MSSPEYRARLYERYASSLECSAVDASRRRPFWEYVAGHLPDKHAQILELGAGRGSFLEFLREAGFERISGVDGSREQVALARARGIEVELADAFASLRRRADASLDAIIAIDVLEHLTKSEVLDLLDECVRVLVPGGRLVVHTVNGDSPFFGTVRFGDFTHETTFTRTSISQVMKAAGFGEIRCFEDKPIVHGVKSALRAVIWRFVRSALVVALAAETGALDNTRVLSQNFLIVAKK